MIDHKPLAVVWQPGCFGRFILTILKLQKDNVDYDVNDASSHDLMFHTINIKEIHGRDPTEEETKTYKNIFPYFPNRYRFLSNIFHYVKFFKDLPIDNNFKKFDIKKVYVDIDPNTLTVDWEVTIGPSSDGYTYEEFDSRGSAGGGEGAVNGQLESMKSYHPNKEAKLVYHYNETIPKCFNSNGTKMEGGCKGTINMQQKFFKFGKKI
jgi:hypothetical protein